MSLRKIIFLLLLASAPAAAQVQWTLLHQDSNRRLEFDEARFVFDKGQGTAVGRVLLANQILDHLSGAYYRSLEVEGRYNCETKTHAVTKRRYYKEDGEFLREDTMPNALDSRVRQGFPEEHFLAEFCRPRPKPKVEEPFNPNISVIEKEKTEFDKSGAALREIVEILKRGNEKVLAETKSTSAKSDTPNTERGSENNTKNAQKSRGAKKTAPASKPLILPEWSYEGANGPAFWGSLGTAYESCALGQNQSPIDLKETILVELPPLITFWQPASFRVLDVNKTLLVTSAEAGAVLVNSDRYAFSLFTAHQPAEHKINGQVFPLEVALLHQSTEGKLLMLSVLFEEGAENAALQQILNHIPLERGGQMDSREQLVDFSILLPENKAYYTFLGSLTAPPCSEGVLWVVMKTPQQASAAQLDIMKRLFNENARPEQAAFNRIIKESR